jgi:hypothetical protein
MCCRIFIKTKVQCKQRFSIRWLKKKTQKTQTKKIKIKTSKQTNKQKTIKKNNKKQANKQN